MVAIMIIRTHRDTRNNWDQSVEDWVAENVTSDHDQYDYRNGIEDRLKRMEEYIGWLTSEMVSKGVVTAEDVVKTIKNISHNDSKIEIVE